MSKTLKLKNGQEVTINVPFTYTIGEEGPRSGNILETIQDCEEEVQLEIDEGIGIVMMIVEQ